MKPRALVVRAPGTNRDHDVTFALELAGAVAERVSLSALIQDRSKLNNTEIVVLAGGFSNADALGAGTLAGLELRQYLGNELRAFVESGRPVLGICNGFQMLVRSGLLPGSLTRNASGAFTCHWVTLEPTANSSVWTSSITEPIECPVAHGEGRYVATTDTAAKHGALRYFQGTNPNGSVDNIAGVTDATGLVLGLMPHPENHVLHQQHPQWNRGENRGLGLSLFAGGVAHVESRG